MATLTFAVLTPPAQLIRERAAPVVGADQWVRPRDREQVMPGPNRGTRMNAEQKVLDRIEAGSVASLVAFLDGLGDDKRAVALSPAHLSGSELALRVASRRPLLTVPNLSGAMSATPARHAEINLGSLTTLDQLCPPERDKPVAAKVWRRHRC
ncbi:hypothetical protein ACWENQ_22895 [Nonomuraea sp. NPDC004354]